MDNIFVTQPFTARHVRFTKKIGFGSLGNIFDLLYVFHKILTYYMYFIRF